MTRRLVAIALVVACGPTSPQDRPDASGSQNPRIDAALTDSPPNKPDAKYVACPPGLPDSFGDLGTPTTNKNGPGSPAMFDSYNVFADLQNNPRWFFAMNLYKGRGVFSGGFQFNTPIDIEGPDTDETTCSACINLFADLDTVDGGPSLHLFARQGRITVTAQSSDQIRVSGKLEDIIFDAIEIKYDSQSMPCSGTNDPVCGNAICLGGKCGRQELLTGCSTSIKNMTF